MRPEPVPRSVAAPAGDLEVRLHRHVDELPEAEWDALAGPDDLLATHRFVKACQDAGVEGAAWRHVAVRQGGRLVAFAPLSCMRVRLDLLSGTALRGAAAVVRRAFPRFLSLPVLLGGLPVSFGTSALRVAPDADPHRVAAAVAGAAERAAAELGAGLIAFKEFPPGEWTRSEPLLDHGYFRAPSLPGCTLELPWRSFDGWLAAMRAGYRRQVRSALRARAAGRLRVRVEPGLGGALDGVLRLYGQVMDRAPHQLERLERPFFERLEAALGPACRTILIERDGALLAAAVLLRGSRTLWFLLAGLDLPRARPHQGYQNLVIEVVAEALRSGAERVELGQTSYAMKGRLGGTPSDRVLYLRHLRPTVNRLLAASRSTLFPRLEPSPRRVFRAP